MTPRTAAPAHAAPATRPRTATAASVLLALVALLSVLVGLLLTMVSGCCGSPDPGTSAPGWTGLAVGGSAMSASRALWSGTSARSVLVAAAVPVGATVALALSGRVDFVALALWLVPGYVALAFACRSRGWQRWLGADECVAARLTVAGSSGTRRAPGGRGAA